MSRPSSAMLLHLDRLDPESGLFASFPASPRVPLLRFAPLPTTGPRLLEAIGSLDENAARLLPNFRRRFPEIYRAVESIGGGLPDGEERSLFFFLSVCSVALALEETDLREGGALSSGLQVDYALLEQKEEWFLDTRTTLRSLWSYKLAEVPNGVLLFSLFESLGQALGAFAGRCGELLGTQALRLSGDLGNHPLLRAGLRRGLPRTFTIAENGPTAGSSDPLPPPSARPAGEGAQARAEG